VTGEMGGDGPSFSSSKAGGGEEGEAKRPLAVPSLPARSTGHLSQAGASYTDSIDWCYSLV
jgi:hypothetical protein